MGRTELGPEFDLAKRMTTLERIVRGLTTRDVLQNASISSGGLQILDGGSLLVDGDAVFNGSLTVPAGSLNTGGNLSAGGSITAGTSLNGASLAVSSATIGSISGLTDLTIGGYLFTPAGYAYDITYTRRAAWLGNDGRLAWASSSITAKELLDEIPEPDVLRILDRLESHHYQRKAELAKHDADPSYHVATEWGGIAEEFHALGLWQVVIYEWDVEWELADVLDANGEPIVNAEGLHLRARVPGSDRRVPGSKPRPVGLHYELLGMLALVGLRQHREEHTQLRREHESIAAQLREAGLIV